MPFFLDAKDEDLGELVKLVHRPTPDALGVVRTAPSRDAIEVCLLPPTSFEAELCRAVCFELCFDCTPSDICRLSCVWLFKFVSGAPFLKLTAFFIAFMLALS